MIAGMEYRVTFFFSNEALLRSTNATELTCKIIKKLYLKGVGVVVSFSRDKGKACFVP